MTSTLHLSAIYVYPIKSLAGIQLDSAAVEARGLTHDRRWMLVDEHNQFLSQRTYVQMALLQTQIGEAGLQVSAPGKGTLVVPYEPQTVERLQVTVWDDTCTAIAVSQEADRWFSAAIGLPCRLVYMPEETIRLVDDRYAIADDFVSFADGYPFLVIGQASLDDLNARLETPVPMNRFRPNFVVSGSVPFAEDSWGHFRIGESYFHGVKPCARCVMTTVDQQTAKKGAEPLRTLATYRAANNKIYFGQNLLYGNRGAKVTVGDTVEVLGFR
jgi:hypothetical protein